MYQYEAPVKYRLKSLKIHFTLLSIEQNFYFVQLPISLQLLLPSKNI